MILVIYAVKKNLYVHMITVKNAVLKTYRVMMMVKVINPIFYARIVDIGINSLLVAIRYLYITWSAIKDRWQKP